jgi:V8-like Glu-specific endopeptidase
MRSTRHGTHSFENLESPFLDEEIVPRGADLEIESTARFDPWTRADEAWDAYSSSASPHDALDEALDEAPVRAASPDEEILGTDDRTLVTNTLKVPNGWICAIDVMSENPKYPRPGESQYVCRSRGTGILVGPRYVLTAGHIFGDDRRKALQLATAHTVSPARNGDNSNSPFGAIKTTAIHFAQPYRLQRTVRLPDGRVTQIPIQRPGDDYALLILEKDVSVSTHRKITGPLGYWGENPQLAVVRRLDPAALQNQDVIIVGYPGDTCGTSRLTGSRSEKLRKIENCWHTQNDKWASTQWRSTGTLTVNAEVTLVFHTADTFDGQSGSPIGLYRGGLLQLVAIHTAPHDTRQNKGVPVTLRMLQEVAGLINADLGFQGATIQNDTLTIQPKAQTGGTRAQVQRFADDESLMDAFDYSADETFELEDAHEAADYEHEADDEHEAADDEHEADASAAWEASEESYESEAIPETAEEEDELLLELDESELDDLASLEEGETPKAAAAKLQLAVLPRHLAAVSGKDVELTPSVMDPGIYDGAEKYKLTEPLQTCLMEAMKRSKLTHIKVALVDLTKGVNKPEFAGFNHNKQVFAASVPKIAAMLGALQLRHDLRGALAQKKSKNLADLFAAVRTDWKGTHAAPYPKAPELERVVADVTTGSPIAIAFRSTGETKDQLSTLIDEFNATQKAFSKAQKALRLAKGRPALEKAAGAKVVATKVKFEAARQAVADLGFLERLRIAIGGNVPASNYAISTIVRDVGYVYIASSLVQSGLHDGKRNGGLWLAADYWSTGWASGKALGSGIAQSATAGSLAAFMTLLAQDRLVSPQASIEMKALMKKEPNPTHPGIASWFKEGLKTLKDEGLLKRVFSKVGAMQGVDDCTLIERKVIVGSTQKLLCYVAVGLRSRESDELIKLILELDKCILANNGLTPAQGGHS